MSKLFALVWLLVSLTPTTGTLIDSMDAAALWTVGSGGADSQGSLEIVDGHNGGQALRLHYDLGSANGAYVQIVRRFDPPLDLSAGDHLRFFYQGTQPNSLEVGLISSEDQPYYLSRATWNRVTHTPWWTYATWDFQDFRRDESRPFPDFTQVRGIFISVIQKGDGDAGGSGSITFDDLHILNLIARSVPPAADAITVDTVVLDKASAWIAARQQPGGLLQSWPEETEQTTAWLYDQALGLLVLSDTHLPQARSLAARLIALQNRDGSWFNGYSYASSRPTDRKKEVGSVAWLVYALVRYSERVPDAGDAYRAALAGADWIAGQQRADGSVSAITEANLDAWWAFQSVGYPTQADRVRAYLLDQVWDARMGRFKSSADAYEIFLDNQTWGAVFLRAVGRPDDARRALSYAQANLAVAGGLDGAGPFAPWNEGTAQYIAQRGENSQAYWDQLVRQQAADGGMPGALIPVDPAGLRAYIVWLSRWHGIAPTAWLYFAGTGGPFPAVLPLD